MQNLDLTRCFEQMLVMRVRKKHSSSSLLPFHVPILSLDECIIDSAFASIGFDNKYHVKKLDVCKDIFCSDRHRFALGVRCDDNPCIHAFTVDIIIKIFFHE